MITFVADFETTTDETDCRVWAWGLCELFDIDAFYYDTSISSMFEFLTDYDRDNMLIYFHNLAFDGGFILDYLLRTGYNYVDSNKNMQERTFTTVISEKHIFYKIEVCVKCRGRLKKITFQDSLKLIPFRVEEIPKKMGLNIKKLEIDYNKQREQTYKLNDNELEYLKHDVIIVALALQKIFTLGLKRMTIGSNALQNYKDLIKKLNFDNWFPKIGLDDDKLMRLAYKGGFTYLSPKYAGKEVKDGIVLDVNSLYPYVMNSKLLPYGEPEYFEGKYMQDDFKPLYIQCFSCQFSLKNKHLPTLQIKQNFYFCPTDYLTSSNNQIVTLTLSSVDCELFFKHYDVFNLTYHYGWKFKGSNILFKDYISKWYELKKQATIEKNIGLRTITKLMLNSLYGKFGTNPKKECVMPYLEDNIVKYKLVEEEAKEENLVYVPVAIFITSWARYVTITSAQANYDRFIYADTDSLHLEGKEIPKNINISDTELGAWKIESEFSRGKFLHQKCYIEEIDGKIKVTIAGMPDKMHNLVSFDNFEIGATYAGKLKRKTVKGGVLLSPTDHTLR